MCVTFQRKSGRFSAGITLLLYGLLRDNYILKITKVTRGAKILQTISNHQEQKLLLNCSADFSTECAIDLT
jgi:hypothetical protein